MNKTDDLHDKPAGAIWLWRVGSLILLILFVAIVTPLELNCRSIQHVESLGAQVITEPYSMFEALPNSWQRWLRDSLGERIHSSGTVTDIYGQNSSISDDELRWLKKNPKLDNIDLSSTQISDAGLSHLKGHTNLRSLLISDNQITDAGLIYLKGLTNLEHLDISDTQISDAGLSHLKGLINLKSLAISNTPVSKEGVAQLQKALPKCWIHY
ncbi:leucine-rich repeat domain-containing protein [Gimesia panareensis]|uniref:leucine-rich repeat domain-containing protein n=1 Tax=Gimesia panareensis TaxID=2527978 RepID=UPI0011887D70|nr:leucine-rich repeat domain-containing protein [Gimesia panareensis]QDU49984.1 Leucine Rich repeats (2 copies) [Gimesia panareensis]